MEIEVHERSMMRAAGALIAVGAVMMLVKGLLLSVTGNDRSLVPWFGLFTSAGLGTTAFVLWRQVPRLGWLALTGLALAGVGLGASAIAVGYLVTGTIPETPDAPAAVGGSYGVLAAGIALSLVAAGIVIVKNRSLTDRWRLLPLSLIAAQFPIFVIAGAIGDGIGSEQVTDGLGLALTGMLWVALGYAVYQHHTTVPRNQPIGA